MCKSNFYIYFFYIHICNAELTDKDIRLPYFCATSVSATNFGYFVI